LSVGTAFHPRTSALNSTMAWGEWSGYFAAAVYADFHDIEYNAIREQAALIDVTPLYKYEITGPHAARLVDRVVTRDVSKLAVDRVVYTPWCNEDGKVVDDGTVARRGEQEFFWTAADPCYRWFTMNAAGLDVRIDDVSEQVAAVALQGPRSLEVL
jgi:aminomethyltransferase